MLDAARAPGGTQGRCRPLLPPPRLPDGRRRPTMGRPPGGPVERLGYRPAFDGLRAVAVVPVLLFHASVWSARGGFLGVDVFFVLLAS